MPLAGFLHKETGEKFSLTEALEHPETWDMPAMLLAGIIKTTQYRGTNITATTLTGCLRRAYWERALPYEADPRDLLYKAFRGSVIHQVLETIASERIQMPGEDGVKVELAVEKALRRFIPERRFSRILALPDGKQIAISGQVDLLEVLEERPGRKPSVLIHDYKTSELFPVKLMAKEGALKPEHIQQTATYEWLISPHFEVKGVELHFIGYSFTATTGKSCVLKEFGREEACTIPEVPRWSEEKTLQTISPLAEQIQRAFDASPKDAAGNLAGGLSPEDPNLPTAAPGDNGWRCASCPFLALCPEGQEASALRQKSRRRPRRASRGGPAAKRPRPMPAGKPPAAQAPPTRGAREDSLEDRLAESLRAAGIAPSA